MSASEMDAGSAASPPSSATASPSSEPAPQASPEPAASPVEVPSGFQHNCPLGRDQAPFLIDPSGELIAQCNRLISLKDGAFLGTLHTNHPVAALISKDHVITLPEGGGIALERTAHGPVEATVAGPEILAVEVSRDAQYVAYISLEPVATGRLSPRDRAMMATVVRPVPRDYRLNVRTLPSLAPVASKQVGRHTCLEGFGCNVYPLFRASAAGGWLLDATGEALSHWDVNLKKSKSMGKVSAISRQGEYLAHVANGELALKSFNLRTIARTALPVRNETSEPESIFVDPDGQRVLFRTTPDSWFRCEREDKALRCSEFTNLDDQLNPTQRVGLLPGRLTTSRLWFRRQTQSFLWASIEDARLWDDRHAKQRALYRRHVPPGYKRNEALYAEFGESGLHFYDLEVAGEVSASMVIDFLPNGLLGLDRAASDARWFDVVTRYAAPPIARPREVPRQDITWGTTGRRQAEGRVDLGSWAGCSPGAVYYRARETDAGVEFTWAYLVQAPNLHPPRPDQVKAPGKFLERSFDQPFGPPPEPRSQSYLGAHGNMCFWVGHGQIAEQKRIRP